MTRKYEGPPWDVETEIQPEVEAGPRTPTLAVGHIESGGAVNFDDVEVHNLPRQLVEDLEFHGFGLQLAAQGGGLEGSRALPARDRHRFLHKTGSYAARDPRIDSGTGNQLSSDLRHRAG